MQLIPHQVYEYKETHLGGEKQTTMDLKTAGCLNLER